METPGFCEAMARTTEGKLIASFRGTGIFELDGSWNKLFEDPYEGSGGEHWAYLAEHDGSVSFATAAKGHRKSGPGNERHYKGTDALWISEDTRLVRVDLMR